MKCLSCDQIITPLRPIRYIGFGRGVHEDEWEEYYRTHKIVQWELRRVEGPELLPNYGRKKRPGQTKVLYNEATDKEIII